MAEPLPRLPTEIWTMIVKDLLPPSSQRSCLSVSRLLHDIAIQPLFSMIRLYPSPCQNKDSPTRDILILDRIVIDTAFARLVKSLVVIIYVPESLDVLDPVVEAGKFAKAIQSMSQLVSFQWIGKAASFPEEVAEAIGSFCPQLRELALPVDGPVYHAPLLNLHNLCALRASWFQVPSSSHKADFGPYCDVTKKFDIDGQLQMMDANQKILRELHLIGPYLDEIPMRIVDSLTHLEIYLPEESFEFAFCHADNLESLVLAGHMRAQLSYLGKTMDIFPRLSSLHLLSFVPGSWPTWQNIGNFIRHRVSLRRLSLNIATSWSDFAEILPIIKDLPALRVLGLNTGYDCVNAEFLAHHLPQTLESLHLAMCWDGYTDVSLLIGVLESLPNLTFLHIKDVGNRLPMTLQEMAHDMKHLRMIGHQGVLWDIVRVGNDETVVPWGRLTWKWLVAADFPGEDSAWLLRFFYTESS